MEAFEIGSDTNHPATLGPDRPFVIAGPCVIESEDHTLGLARKLAEVAVERGVDFIFKASFDKANRTSIDSYRGPGLEEGLRILARVRAEVGVPILTDLHEAGQAEAVARVVDVLQIPAFLCRQTDLIVACAETGRPLNIKKGQFMAPGDMEHVVAKARQAGATQIALTDRGTSFGYNTLISDMRGLVELAAFGCLVVFDATHSVQTPGGQGASSGGRREFIEPLIRAAVATGVNGVFVEVHDDPAHAKSDGPNALELERFGHVLDTIIEIDRVRRSLAAARI